MNSKQEYSEQEPSSTRLIVSLAIAGFISGLAIIGIYIATFDTIKHNKAQELRAAVFKVLPGATQMQPLRYDGNRLGIANDDEVTELTIYGGYDDTDSLVGYAIPSAGPGFQDTIKVLYGFQTRSRQIIGMEILESRETPGLGDKIYKDEEFVANFEQLLVDPTIRTVKKGAKSAANEVDAITGATISSKAVVRIINEANQRWLSRLPNPGMEPALQKKLNNIPEHGENR